MEELRVENVDPADALFVLVPEEREGGMTTWAEWFAYLDGRLDRSIGEQLPEIDEFIRGNRQSQAELGLVLRGSRAPVLDELSSTTLFLDQLLQSAAESHFLAASLLYSQGKEASWLPAALPNSEESRLVRRAVRCWKAQR